MRAYSRTFAAVRTTACYVERANDMEELFFKFVVVRFRRDTRRRVIEYAFHARARGAYVSARVATDTLGKLFSPERKSFVFRHRFEFFYFFKAVYVFFTAFVKNDFFVLCLMRFVANRTLGQYDVGFVKNGFTQGRNYFHVLFHHFDVRYERATFCLDFFDIEFADTFYRDHVHVFTVDAVFFHELVKAVRIARL